LKPCNRLTQYYRSENQISIKTQITAS
jgi:hypothetical protein